MVEYLNTGLVVSSPSTYILDRAFKDAGLVALGVVLPETGLSGMGYETENQHDAPEPNIEVFLNVIETLDEVALGVWNKCEQREFDIGYRCDTKPRSFHHSLSPELLKRI